MHDVILLPPPSSQFLPHLWVPAVLLHAHSAPPKPRPLSTTLLPPPGHTAPARFCDVTETLHDATNLYPVASHHLEDGWGVGLH